jgi:DNA-binding MarR family transcriptional regulator
VVNPERSELTWTCLSNHGHVLVCLARNPDARLRDVASKVGITERAVQKIVSDLEAGGVLTREKDGRRNRYQLHADPALRHPLEAHRTVGDLLRMLLTDEEIEQNGLDRPRIKRPIKARFEKP